MTTPPPEEPTDEPAGGGSTQWRPDDQPQQPGYDHGGAGYGPGGPAGPAGPGAPGYGGPGYGGPGYGGSGYGGPGYGYAVPDHPKSTTAMVLGILGVVVCQVLAPFALVIGKRTVAEIDAAGGRLGGRGQAQAGYILGIIGSVLLGLSVILLVVYFVILTAMFGGTMASS